MSTTILRPFATDSVQAGTGIADLANIAGHRPADTSAPYAQASGVSNRSWFAFGDFTADDIPDDSTIDSVVAHVRHRLGTGAMQWYGWKGVQFGGGTSGAFGVLDINPTETIDLAMLRTFSTYNGGHVIVLGSSPANAGVIDYSGVWLEVAFTPPAPPPPPPVPGGKPPLTKRQRDLRRRRRLEEEREDLRRQRVIVEEAKRIAAEAAARAERAKRDKARTMAELTAWADRLRAEYRQRYGRDVP